MIFTPDNAKKILAKQKTQTRRLIRNDANIQEELAGKNGQKIAQFSPGYPGGRVKWEVGKTYAIQPGRGKPAVGRIKITRIWAERLWDISGSDAIAEGVDLDQSGRFWILSKDNNAVLAYMTLWNSLHTKKGTRWEDNPEVWAIEFELVDSISE